MLVLYSISAGWPRYWVCPEACFAKGGSLEKIKFEISPNVVVFSAGK
jgi:hypothetical protein